jgi:tight adherence protein C
MASFGSAELSLITGLLLAGTSVYLFVSAMFGANNDKELLARASGDERPKSKSAIINISRPLVEQFTLKYALKIKSESYRKRIKKLLLTSGMSRELTVDEFIGLQFFWGVMFPVFMLIMNFALELEIPYILLIPLVPFGFYMPQLHAGGMKNQRLIDVQVNLPFFIDLLALSTEAGLDFIGAIQRIVDKSEENVLSEELQIVLKDIKLGSSRLEALRQMSLRLDIPEITSFIAVLADADATGASISQVLKDQSVQMRLERFVRAEKAGARASQAILIPMMVFILPAVFVMVFGPVALQFMSGQGGP